MKLSGNTILITGGSSGIGMELTKQLHRLGNTVIITGRNPKRLEEAKEKIPGIHAIQSDVSDVKQIQSLYSKLTQDFPKLNIVINNAGIMKIVNMHAELDLTTLASEIDINFSGPVHMTKVFLPHLKRQTEAAIINVSSGLAFVPLPTSPIYCATKAALHSFTQSLRVQLKNTKVKVFEFAPPATQTELLATFDMSDMKGIPIMKVDEMVKICIKGLENNDYEVRPGPSNQLKFMSRLAPGFILKQMSKGVDRMLQSN